MPKRQRQYKRGTEYKIKGPSKRERRVKFVGRAKLYGKETLLFQPVRRIKKRRNPD